MAARPTRRGIGPGAIPAHVRGAAFAVVVALGLGAAAAWRGRAAPPVTPESSARARTEDPFPLPMPHPPPHADAATPAATPPTSGLSSAPEVLLDEATLMNRLRGLEETDAALRAELAREVNRRFPDSADAPERASILVHALATLGRASEARGEAEDMVNRYPDSKWVHEVERFTGAHRHRNFRLAEDGALESY